MDSSRDDAISAATSSLLRAVNASDLDRVLAVWDHDGILMPPQHPSVRGRPAIEEHFENLFRHSRFEFVFAPSRIDASSIASIAATA